MVIKAARLGMQILKANFDRDGLPFKLTFLLTFRCQSRCKTCSIWEMKPENELTLAEIEKFAFKMPTLAWLNLTGGEITLRDDLVEICRVFSKHCPLYFLSFATNGLAPKIILEQAREIVKLPIPRIMIGVSLDGDEKVNDEIRGIRGDWKKALETYKGLRALAKKHRNFRTYIGHTVSPFNQGKFMEFYEALKREVPDLKPREIHVNVFHSSPHYYHLEGGMTLPQVTPETIEKIDRWRGVSLNPIDWMEHKYLKLAQEYLKTGRTPLPCHAVRTSCFIDSWGTVYPCTIYEKKIGSLRESDYDLPRILKSAEAEEAKREAEELRCPNCWTPCEAYQMILTNAFRRSAPASSVPVAHE